MSLPEAGFRKVGIILTFFGSIAEETLVRLLLGTALCTALAYGARRKGALNSSGAIVAWLLGISIVGLVGLSWLIIILVFFVVGAISTKYKYGMKEEIGVAQDRLGARSWRNVMANGITPLAFVISEFIYPGAIFLVGYLGAVSAALADTVSSEVGLTSARDPRLVTSFKKVKPGTHGGISLLGTGVSLLGCLLLGVVAWYMRMEPVNWELIPIMVFCVVGGMLGSLADSILGALFERKQKMSNSQVNLVATLVGGIAAIAVYLTL